MLVNFDAVPDRRNSDSIKWNYYEADVLPLWVADMDFPSPPPVLQAIQDRVAHGILGYGITRPGLPEAIVDWVKEKYQWQVSADQIVLVPGVVSGFNLAVHAFSAPGEGVLIQTPVYPPILKVGEATGRVRHAAPLVQGPDGRYEIDFDRLEAAVQPDTRLMILCNPHNPVGRVFDRVELERLAEFCLRHDLLICSDEIHSDIIFSGCPHTPIASLSPEVARRCITLMAPSKTFNIAGLACSFAIVADPNLRKQYGAARQGLMGFVNLLGQEAALAAYRHGQPWLDELLAYLEANRNFLYENLPAYLPGVTMVNPEGTYLAWLDCRNTAIPGRPCDFFLNKARVALNNGAEFGEEGKGFVRLNFGCPRPILVEALERMKKAMAENL